MRPSTLVLVLTDVEGSTRLWAEHPDAMSEVMRRHHELVHRAIEECGGWRPVDQGEGDAVFGVFESASAALQAAARFQLALQSEPWPEGIRIRDRVGVHAGDVLVRDGNVFGTTVARAARVRGLGAGGQVLLTAAVFELVRDGLPDGLTLLDLGEHRMKDLIRPERLYQLGGPGLPTGFPPLAALEKARHNLPVQATGFVGREREIRDLVELLARERLVTIVGFGGMGKTRLALQVAAELADGTGDGVWFVDLSDLSDPGQVPATILDAVGVREGGDGALPELLAWLDTKRLLLVLDNAEQLLPDVTAVLREISTAAPGVHVLVTSREPLRLRGEQVYELGPLPVPPPVSARSHERDTVISISAYAAVTLFLDRASAVRRDFALTTTNAAAVAAICGRLEGMPLALELAAARLRAMSPETLLARLEQALKVLTGGSRDLPPRQQTLRATIGWSFEHLEPEEQRLLARLSVFPGSFTLQAAEAVAGPAALQDAEEVDVLDGLASLVDRSFLRHRSEGASNEDRYSMLAPIRDFAAEWLEHMGETERLRDLHARYYSLLIALPADWSPRDRAASDAVFVSDWHNVRPALDRVHERHDPDEVDVLEVAVRALDVLSQDSERDRLEERLLRQLPPELTDRRRLRVTLLRAYSEFAIGRRDRAARRLEDAVPAARELAEPSLLAFALTLAAGAAEGEDASLLFREAEALIPTMPATGLALPRWWVADLWTDFAMDGSYLEPARAEAIQRRRLADAEGPFRYAEQLQLGLVLQQSGRFAEAVEVLREFGDVDGAEGAFPDARVVGAQYLAVALIAVGDLERATAALAVAQHRADILPSADRTSVIDLLRAWIDRLRGRPESAEQRLRVMRADVRMQSAVRAAAVVMLAVVRREAGDLAEAADLLREAQAAERYLDRDDRLLLAMEGALQHVESNPEEAARRMGTAQRLRPAGVRIDGGTWLLDNGVEYDVGGMLARLEEHLGRGRLAELLGPGAEAAPADSDSST